MEPIVIDSSVAIKWLVGEPYSDAARRLLGRYQSNQLEFLAPDLLNAEIANVIWKKQRFQGLKSSDARKMIHAFRALRFHFTASADLIESAFELAVAHQRSVYDAIYLALSLRAQCPFITADEKLVNAVSASLPQVVWIAGDSQLTTDH